MHKSNHQICYRHTDASGLMYHTCYLEFFEAARMQLLTRLVGSGQLFRDWMDQQSCVFAIRRLAVDYKHGVYLADQVSITSEILNLKSCRAYWRQTMARQDQDCAVVTLETVCLDPNFRPRSWPDALKNLLKENQYVE